MYDSKNALTCIIQPSHSTYVNKFNEGFNNKFIMVLNMNSPKKGSSITHPATASGSYIIESLLFMYRFFG